MTSEVPSGTARGRSIEVAYNLALAHLLRLEGFSAEGEQPIEWGDARGQADVILDFDDYAAIIEAEFGKPAKADGDKRFPEDGPLIARGLPVRLVVAVGYPEHLGGLPESESRENLAACQDLVMTFRYFGEDWSSESTGSVQDLAETLRDFWVRSDDGSSIDQIVGKVGGAIDLAAQILSRAEANDLEDQPEDQDEQATRALIWFNAMLFQELLARHLDVSLLPPEHQRKQIARPDPDEGPSHLLDQWEEILEINWWPIFDIAREALKSAPAPANAQAIRVLKRAAAEIAETGAIRRHDVAGRIFHRLLDARKFLATNYTTVSAAIMLAGLAFGGKGHRLSGTDFGNPATVAQLRIVDPACGSGTLLMAAAQEVFKRGRQTWAENEGEVVRATLENGLYGFDVVPAAIHLAVSTLCMAETRQLIQDMKLWRLRHEVVNGVPRMGSLDFLPGSPSGGAAIPLGLFGDESSVRVTGEGEIHENVNMPTDCHLVIANPPFTRAGGPGDQANTLWNPIFGSLLDNADARSMQNALAKTLNDTPASMYAGLASAFLVLAHQNVATNGRIAFVLPGTVLTGSRWSEIRRLLIENYCIDWVVVSHDKRSRPKRKNLPGRLWVSFSESTRRAEVLIVATRARERASANHVRFVNLLRNPDDPIPALSLTRELLEMAADESAPVMDAQRIGQAANFNGSLLSVPQRDLTTGPWPFTAFVQAELAVAAVSIAAGDTDWQEGIQIRSIGDLAALGPYHMQVKNPKQGLFRITESDDPLEPGEPALWRHDHRRITRIQANADARLVRRGDRDRADQDRMLARAGRLHFPAELRMAPQRVGAVITEEAMIGVRSWITLCLKEPALGMEEALCLWLNSTPGLLLRIAHSNRPFLGRSESPHEVTASLPVLDVTQLSASQLSSAKSLYEELRDKTLQGFGDSIDDPVRSELNDRLCTEVLRINPEPIRKLTETLMREPTLHARS